MKTLILWLGSATLVLAATAFDVHNTGSRFPVNYEQFGEFKSPGTAQYEYVIQDDEQLSEAVGDAIYPNNYTIFTDPAYRRLTEERRLTGSRWDLVKDLDQHACYLKWATVEDEEPGVKLFYIAQILQEAGHIEQAAKAYHACIVHFPRSIGWTYWQTPWYVGPTAIDRLEVLLRNHPELGYQLVGAEIIIENGFDHDIGNDIISVNPGRMVPHDEIPPPAERGQVIQRRGGKHGLLEQFEDGTWQFVIDGKPMLIKAMAYKPTPVMQSYDEGTMSDWMTYDSDGDGIADAPYQAWVDKNRNNIQDPDELAVGDLQLMKDMGVNTLRVYQHTEHAYNHETKIYNLELYREIYKKYGFRFMVGDYIGMYCVGSGADWDAGTDYADPQQQANMLENVKQMVMTFKDEPYVNMWVLGNENNYGGVFGHTGGVGNAAVIPRTYYKFVNDLAKWIKSVDPTRPVAICNGDLGFLNIFAELCPDVDVFGPNAYRGSHGFGSSMWGAIKRHLNRPGLIMEFGCPAFFQGKPFDEAFRFQAEYHEGTWKDIAYHSYQGRGHGTALGGVIFEWLDGWWKSGQPPRFSPAIHETVGQWPGPFPDGWSHEEWFGICGHGDGTGSPFLRTLRPVYFMYQKLWNET